MSGNMFGDTPPDGVNGTRYRLRDHERRIAKLEEANIGVLTERVRNLDKDVQDLKDSFSKDLGALRTAHYQLIGGILIAIVSFALIVGFAL